MEEAIRGGIGASRGVEALLLPVSDLPTGLWGLASLSCSPMGLVGGLLRELRQAQDPGAIIMVL